MSKFTSLFKLEAQEGKSKLDSFVKTAVVWIVILTPVFFLTFINVPLSVGKGSVLFLAIVLVSVLWILARLKDGDLVVPKSALLLALAGIPLTFLLSALFSDSIRMSMIGSGFEMGTFTAMFLLTILAFLVATSLDSVKRIFSVYSGLFYIGIAAFVYFLLTHLLSLFNVAPPLKLPMSFVGSMNDTAIYFGFLAVLAMVTLELIVLSKRMRTLVISTLVVSLAGMTIINFTTGWIIVGFFALLTFVYALSFGGKNITTGNRQLPTTSLTVVLLALFFTLASGPIGSLVSDSLNIQNTEIRPSWLGTMEVAKSTVFDEGIKETVFGAGPNRFASKWVLHKPEGINTTIAWNTDFTYGVGILPSFVVTTGLLGLITLLAFLGMFLMRGAQLVLASSATSDKVTRYALTSSFFSALYLWTVVLFYVANIVILSFAFIFTGIVVAALVHAGIVKKYEVNILQDPRVSFFAVLMLIVMLLVSVVGGYALIQRFGSTLYYQNAVVLLNSGDVDGAQGAIERALAVTKQDYYHRDLSSLYILRLNEVLNTDASEETIRTRFQENARRAIDHAIEAVVIDDSNYQNYAVLAQAYQALIPFGLEEGYNSANDAYNQAVALNPNAATIPLDRARLELTQGNMPRAKEYIGQALELKGNYTAAIFLLSQIQVEEGNIAEAIESTQVASIISPNDMGVFFQLGFLKYQNEDYAGAASAFERAVEINPFYANAMYFLGLSYDQVGRDDRAIEMFERVLELNPGNTEVQGILSNLRAGRGAFESDRVPPPVIEPPEERDEPPLDEEEVGL